MKYIFTLLILSIFLASCTGQNLESQTRDPCASLQGESKDLCLNTQVSKALDNLIPTCAKIQGKEKKADCYGALLAYDQVRFDCNAFEEMDKRDECYMLLGSNNRRIEVCNRINNPTMKDYCYFENVKFFASFDDICKNIVSESLKQKCFDTIAAKVQNEN